MNEINNPITVLQKALDLLKRSKWIQNQDSCNGGYCIRGAIKASLQFDGGKEHLSYVQIRDTYLGISDLSSWNDEPSRNRNEVIMLLEKAIIKAEQDKKDTWIYSI